MITKTVIVVNYSINFDSENFHYQDLQHIK